MRPGLLITGASAPARRRSGARPAGTERCLDDAVAALVLLLDTHVEGLATLVADMAAQLLDAETELMVHDHHARSRELMSARRTSAQLHRMVGGLRSTLQRMERDQRLPPPSGRGARDAAAYCHARG
jgi:Mg2+ and Co2+ transporter CorA